MTYLVQSDFGIEEFPTYEQVLNYLRQCTAFWCAGNDYEGEDFETLYENCLAAGSFEDIAQVYKIDAYSLYLLEGECTIKRIY